MSNESDKIAASGSDERCAICGCHVAGWSDYTCLDWRTDHRSLTEEEKLAIESEALENAKQFSVNTVRAAFSQLTPTEVWAAFTGEQRLAMVKACPPMAGAWFIYEGTATRDSIKTTTDELVALQRECQELSAELAAKTKELEELKSTRPELEVCQSEEHYLRCSGCGCTDDGDHTWDDCVTNILTVSDIHAAELRAQLTAKTEELERPKAIQNLDKDERLKRCIAKLIVNSNDTDEDWPMDTAIDLRLEMSHYAAKRTCSVIDAGAKCRVCGHYETSLRRAMERYAHCPSCGRYAHWEEPDPGITPSFEDVCNRLDAENQEPRARLTAKTKELARFKEPKELLGAAFVCQLKLEGRP